jgi:Ca2+-transporting ATPase
MKRPPRPTKEPVINKDMLYSIVVIAIADTIAVLGVFYLALQRFPGNVMAAQTIAFSTLVCSELLRAYTSRSETYSIFSIGVFSNKWMVLATGSSFLMLLLVVYLPFLQPFVDTVYLSLSDWLMMLPFMFIAPTAAEIVKVFLRRKAVRPAAAAVAG